MSKEKLPTTYLSRVIFVIMYIFDLIVLFSITKNLAICALGAICIIIVIIVSMPVTRYVLKAYPIEKTQKNDTDFLNQCFERVMSNCIKSGYKKSLSHFIYATV